MIIGVPTEIKTHEYRVGLTPTSVRELASHRHQVIVEEGAGTGIGATDAVYEKAGARIGDPWEAELIVKVKEPQGAERARLQERQVLFTYLHLRNGLNVARGKVTHHEVAAAVKASYFPAEELLG